MVLLLSLFSCQKEDATPPIVEVFSPLSASSFDVLDYISVSGLATDESALEWVEIKLLNSDLVLVADPIVLYSTENEFSFSASIHIADIHLHSGNYFLKVAASDGENITSNYTEIVLSAVPLALKNTYLISSAANSFSLYEVSGNNSSLTYTFQGQFQSGMVNSYHQYLFFGSDLTGYGYNADYDFISWEIPLQLTTYNFFNRAVYSQEDHLNYISHGNGSIKAYDKNGNVLFSSSMNAGEYPEDVLVFNDKVFAEIYSTSFNRDLVVYFKSSGTESHRIAVDKDIVTILPKSADELYFFTNNGTSSEFFIYVPTLNTFWSPHSMPQGEINDVVAISDNELIIAHQTGLLRYTYQNNSLVPIVSGIEFNKVKYDALNGVVVASSANELNYYSNLGNPIGQVVNSEPIADFYFFYNK